MNKRTIRITRELIKSNIQNNPTPKSAEHLKQMLLGDIKERIKVVLERNKKEMAKK